MKRLWLLSFLLVEACSKPTFSFRGFTDLSDCRSVIDSELADGATFNTAFDALMPGGDKDGTVTHLDGKLGTVPIAIFVSCYRNGKVSSVDYIANVADTAASSNTFDAFDRELKAIYGEGRDSFTRESRRKTYVCGEPATVVLREAQLAQADYEVSLLVVPHPSDC